APTGGRYNPTTDSWNTMNTDGAPTVSHYSAIWTGAEMIIWGGFTNTGARYFPPNDSWMPTTTTNAPASRFDNIAVWTRTIMIVWGGTDSNDGTNDLNTGGRYCPGPAPQPSPTPTVSPTPTSTPTPTPTPISCGQDQWTPTSTVSAPAGRDSHSAVWTGTEM